MDDPQKLVDQALGTPSSNPPPPKPTPPLTPPPTEPTVAVKPEMPKQPAEKVPAELLGATPTPTAGGVEMPLAFAGAGIPNPPPPLTTPTMTPPPTTPPPTASKPVTPGVMPVMPPKKKGGRGKIVGVVMAILLLLGTVVGGMFGYTYYTKEPNMISVIVGFPICDPGEKQSRGCTTDGCAGSQSRTCNSTGTNWGGWSGCSKNNSSCGQDEEPDPPGTACARTFSGGVCVDLNNYNCNTTYGNSDCAAGKQCGVNCTVKPTDPPASDGKIADGKCMAPGDTCASGKSQFDNTCPVTESRCGDDLVGPPIYVDATGESLCTADKSCANGYTCDTGTGKCVGNTSLWCGRGLDPNAPVCCNQGVKCEETNIVCEPPARKECKTFDQTTGSYKWCLLEQNSSWCGGGDDEEEEPTPTPSPSPSPSPSQQGQVPTLACTSLTKNKADSAIEVGTNVTFTCAGSVSPAGATNLTYAFRISKDSGAWQTLPGTGATASYAVASAGNYRVQCKACGTINNASVCDPTWGAAQ